MANDLMMEALAIRTVVDNWVLWRDAGDWERFRTVWHDDGVMMATWFQGTADEFIRVSRKASSAVSTFCTFKAHSRRTSKARGPFRKPR